MGLSSQSMAAGWQDDVGPHGNYLTNRHTAMNCRPQLWNSEYFGPNIPLSNGSKPDIELFDRIDADLHEILERHTPPELQPQIQEQLKVIQQRYECT
jgi:hypothetical protein